MKILRNPDVENFFRAILLLEDVEECYSFFEDACTIKEILDISQRFKVARMLMDGENYVSINKATGVSTATISRVNKCLEYGDGGYKSILEKLDRLEKEGK